MRVEFGLPANEEAYWRAGAHYHNQPRFKAPFGPPSGNGDDEDLDFFDTVD